MKVTAELMGALVPFLRDDASLDDVRAAIQAYLAASPSIGRVGGDAARALGLLAAEDERNDKIHDLLETIREQIRLEVAPEHRPDGLMKNIQNAVYAMRGRMRLMNDAAITSPLSSLVSHEEPAGDTQGALPVEGEAQPAIWVSAAQLAEHVDPDPRDGSEGGNYLPARMTRRGLFQTPLYAHPPAALVSPPDNGEPTDAMLESAFRVVWPEAEWDELECRRVVRNALRAALQSHNEGSDGK